MMQNSHNVASVFVLGSFVAACTAKVFRLPKPGESLSASAFALEAGGKGLNLAVAARRLGADVDGLIAIGDDDLSALAEPALRRADLPPSMLRRRAAPTGAGVGFIADAGETCLAVHSGANLLLSADDVRGSAESIAAAAVTLAQFEISDAPIVEAFRLARKAGRLTVLNPSPFRMPDRQMLGATSILVVNAVEAAALAAAFDLPLTQTEGVATPAADALFELGPEALVVTLGARGALVTRAGEAPFLQCAYPVHAIDTLGAGDAFAAGLAVSLAEGRSWAESAARAAACGALVAARFGVFDALPTRAAVDEMVAGAASGGD